MAALDAATNKEELVERIVEEIVKEIKCLVGKALQTASGRLLDVEVAVWEGVLSVGQRMLAQILAAGDAGYQGSAVECGCGGKKQFEGYRSRKLVSLAGEIEVRRAYYHCGACGEGWVPLDAVLGLDGSRETEGVKRCLSLVGSEKSFVQAQRILWEVGRIAISARTLESVTEEVGKEIGEVLAQEEEAIFAERCEGAPSAPKADELYVSMDAAKVLTREGWRDMKVGAIYTTKSLSGREVKEAREGVMDHVSYVTGIEECDLFGRKVYAESVRRGMQESTRMNCLGDGAAWIWNQNDLHFPNSRQWIDWWHVTEWVWDTGKALHGEGTPSCASFADEVEAFLWKGEVEAAIAWLKARRPHRDKQKEELRRLENRLRENQARLPNYNALQAQGYHIGSGVEPETLETLRGISGVPIHREAIGFCVRRNRRGCAASCIAEIAAGILY